MELSSELSKAKQRREREEEGKENVYAV